jgi:hypothetical protein
LTVKVYEPAALGVPEITPAVDNVSPVGSVPLPRLNEYGLVPPVNVIVCVYAVPEVPPGRLDGDKAVPVQLTVTEYCWLPVQLYVSVACTVKVNVPDKVGVPDSTPAVLSVRPFGNVPALLLNVYGLLPPLALTVSVYATPTVPPDRLLGETVMLGQPMVIENCLVAVHSVAVSVDITVNVEMPAAVGVPDTVPPELRLKPAGRPPLSRLYVYGPVPPLVVSPWL